MTDEALQTALAYHRAWTGKDLDAAMEYIADDIVCDAPGAECVTVEDGKIVRSRFLFDRKPFDEFQRRASSSS